jgi:hypothetical protein
MLLHFTPPSTPHFLGPQNSAYTITTKLAHAKAIMQGSDVPSGKAACGLCSGREHAV